MNGYFIQVIPVVPDVDRVSCSLGFRFDPQASAVFPRFRTGNPPPDAVYRLCPALVIDVPHFTILLHAAHLEANEARNSTRNNIFEICIRILAVN